MLAVGLFRPTDAASAERRAARPNVVIIVTDDQRIGTPEDVMPKTLRWFAEEGTTYTRAFVTTPLCCPSRASILTGRYAHNHGVQTNSQAERLAATTTLQYYLQKQGYTTAIFGKLLNRWDINVNPPYWNRWSLASGYSYYDGTWNDQGAIKTVSRYSTSYISKVATRFVRARESQDQRPWFLYVAPLAAHAPFTPEPKYVDARVPPLVVGPAMRERDHQDKPKYVRDRVAARTDSLQKGTETRAKQLRTLMSVDDLVAGLFRTLALTGEDEDTLAVFVSDNGYLWGDHGLNGKGFPYTPSIRTPLYLRWPRHIPAGARNRRLAANIDIAPTVLDAVRASAAGRMDGRSLLETSTRRRVLTESWKDPGHLAPRWASIRTSSYQYIEIYNTEDELKFREYYDLRRDPAQLVNLLRDGNEANDPDLVSLSAQLASDRLCSGGSCP